MSIVHQFLETTHVGELQFKVGFHDEITDEKWNDILSKFAEEKEVYQVKRWRWIEVDVPDDYDLHGKKPVVIDAEFVVRASENARYPSKRAITSSFLRSLVDNYLFITDEAVFVLQNAGYRGQQARPETFEDIDFLASWQRD
ncbi:MAG: hypothetical protein KZQ65_02410 [Candidatus Thiodiazotropha sp. (ex Gloverina cf. vestifex)]|nr:hypothetical protein [Candidatus Thiodiazotropha sp. (ex Gloverina cf. vestifex)]